MNGMGLGKENGTTCFAAGMGELDDSLKAMTAMLNRSNRAEILIGIGPDGEPSGEDLSEDDIPEVVRRMSAKIDHLPEYSVNLDSLEGRPFIRISARGYETPYTFDGWFYIRKCRLTRDGQSHEVREEWIQTLTCAMVRH
ncbi:hypothetical protein TALC_01006 [Thermoplasmatales archaeon BRNA1]|nr:hypothetical protein TALC_01006 [Thermoplasmatales archaeon BRNA1]